MRMSEQFIKWFQFNGWMDDGWNMEAWQRSRIEKIAWRSYRKGVADTKAKFNNSLNEEKQHG